MSTRSQIEFSNKWKDDKGKLITETRTVYRHSDGYPEGVLPDLREFLKWNGAASDVEYASANFVYWNKKRQIESLNRHGKMSKEDTHRWETLGFGFCENGEYHKDIEYLYKVITENEKTKVEAYEVGHEGGRWKGKQIFKRIRPRIKGVKT